jgi:hypothetical protein
MLRFLSALSDRMTQPLKPAPRRQVALFDAAMVTATSIALVAAYVFQPVQRFASYGLLFLGGLLIAMALVPRMVIPRHRMSTAGLWTIGTPLVLAGAVLFLAGQAALHRSDWNDRRCMRLQRAMLHPTPTTRTDLPDVFTALGCRPQGDAPVDLNYEPRRDRPPTRQAAEAHMRFEQRALEDEVQLNAVGDIKGQQGR